MNVCFGSVRKLGIAAALLSASMVSGCSEGAKPAESTAAPSATAKSGVSAEAAKSEATQIFSTRCTACHGPTGAGDGPASAGLTPKPAKFSDGAWQAKVSDQHIEQIIQYGGAAVGKSPAMPSNPDLTSKPEVVAALRAHIRELSH